MNPSKAFFSSRFVKEFEYAEPAVLVWLEMMSGCYREARGRMCSGFVSCKKKNRNAKNMASAGARAYMGV